MFSAFFTGFFLGLSLIVAIGAQNAFVLRQGILRQHVFYIALFCSIADALLIIIGIAGISYFFNDFINEYSKIIFGYASLWLCIYGFIRLKSVFKGNSKIIESNIKPSSLKKAISITAIFTFANPHVYLDTMILIGSISQQFEDFNRVYFLFGACLASFAWFFVIAYGAKLLTPLMQTPKNWRAFDAIISSIMFIIAFKLASQGGWF
ncbi:LysE family transporter [Candidatus Pseudothioglobus singularis]|nr:LysE family transporter [Candidatus Pseudothioglobus singularis]